MNRKKLYTINIEERLDLAGLATPELPRCRRCGRRPHDVGGYPEINGDGSEDCLEEEHDAAMREHEGTYNRHTGGYWCDFCYIVIGQPLGVAH